jgi:DNA ligase-1
MDVLDAHIWTPKVNPVGWFISEKLDGVRGYWTGTQFISHRAGNPFTPPAEFIVNFPPFALDGELYLGRGKFQKGESAVVTRSSVSPVWKELHYMIFDVPDAHGGLMARLNVAKDWFRDHPSQYIKFVQQTPCTSVAQMKTMLTEVVAMGGEGLMLHKADAPYERKRSNTLLKVKLAEDDEAELIGYTPGEGKYEGYVGAFMLQRPDKVIFKCGAGLTDALRMYPPPLGTIITYKFDGLASKGKPRNPRFKRISKEKNEPKPTSKEIGGLETFLGPVKFEASSEKEVTKIEPEVKPLERKSVSLKEIQARHRAEGK